MAAPIAALASVAAPLAFSLTLKPRSWCVSHNWISDAGTVLAILY